MTDREWLILVVGLNVANEALAPGPQWDRSGEAPGVAKAEPMIVQLMALGVIFAVAWWATNDGPRS